MCRVDSKEEWTNKWKEKADERDNSKKRGGGKEIGSESEQAT